MLCYLLTESHLDPCHVTLSVYSIMSPDGLVAMTPQHTFAFFINLVILIKYVFIQTDEFPL